MSKTWLFLESKSKISKYKNISDQNILSKLVVDTLRGLHEKELSIV